MNNEIPKRNSTAAPLLARLSQGDRGALAELMASQSQRLLDRIRLMMGPEARRVAESTDFLQSVFAEAFASLDRFEPRDDKALLRWLTAIARNNIRDDVRKKREESLSALSSTLSGLHGALPHDGETPSAEAAMNDDRLRLAEALEAMDERQRAVIELRYLEGLRFPEIGARLSCSEDAARMLHQRALLRLGGLLGGG